MDGERLNDDKPLVVFYDTYWQEKSWQIVFLLRHHTELEQTIHIKNNSLFIFAN